MKSMKAGESSNGLPTTGAHGISCALSASDLKDRVESWNQLIGGGIVECDWVPGGVRVRAVPGFQLELTGLIELERECCPWIQFRGH